MAADETGQISAANARALVHFLEHVHGHGVIFMDAEGFITGWSKGASYITGFTANDVIGRPLSSLFTTEDRDRSMPQQELNVARALGCAQDERWHLRKDGSRFWSSGLTYAQHDDAGGVASYLKIFRDATHLRTRMRYLENVLEQRDAEHAERDIFLGTIAHELRNPLAPIRTVLTIMQATPDISKRHEASLKVIDRQLGFMQRLIEDLVDLTRARVGKLNLAYQRVVLQSAILDAMSDVHEKAQAAGVALDSVLPEQPLEAEVDAERLQQVLANLLNNAIKFTPPGGKVWVTLNTDQTHFFLTVKDTGRGIPTTLLPNIFDAFTQASDAGSRRGDGLGLGLSVVKEIVSLHRGTVEVRSEGEGKGAEFAVRIPLREQPVTGYEEAGGDGPENVN